MDNAQPPSRSHLFTVRVWREDLGQGQTEWRGEVHDVVSGERRYFPYPPTLVTLVREMLPQQEGTSVRSHRNVSGERNHKLARTWLLTNRWCVL
jgi:hypothetical protein